MNPNWNDLYLEGQTPWDKGVPSPPLLEWLKNNPGRIVGRVLVPGCGTGHDVRALAAGEGIETVTGLDISPLAVKRAQEYPSVGRERYETGDLFALGTPHHGAYDWVWEHTCFCAIPPEMRGDYVEAVHRCLNSCGQFLGVFYLDPYDDEHSPGEGPPHGAERSELAARFLESGRFLLLEETVPTLAYEGREGRELLLRMQKVG